MKGTVSVNEETREIESWSEGDLIQAIHRRQRANEPLCIRVHIEQGCANVSLSTPMCQRGVGGRAPNECESRLLTLWDSLGLNTRNFKGNDVVRFLHDARHVLN